MSESKDYKKVITNLLLSQLFAVLSTYGKDGPHSVIVCTVVCSGLKELIFVTPKNSRKYKNLLEYPRVSLFLDNRKNSLHDLHDLTGVEIKGRASTVGKEDRESYRNLFLARFPELAGFYDSDESAVIRVSVSIYELITDINKVKVLDLF